MRPRHVLRAEGAAAGYVPLFAAAAERGMRVGWLELAAPPPPEPSFGELLEAGAFRVVSVGAGLSLALKPMQGPPVLRDVLREHFKGCALVLVRGEVELPHLLPAGDEWDLRGGEGGARRLSTEALLASLGGVRL